MDDLLIKYLLGEASSEEIALVERWLAEDAANKVRYEQFRTVWKIGRRTAASAPQDTGVAWQQVRERLQSGAVVDRRMRIGRLAAVVAGVLLLSAGLYFNLNAPAPSPVANVLPRVVPGGGRTFITVDRPRTDTLPDRSVVTLNRRSSLSWISGLVDRGLTIRLKGEGFFRIAHNPSHPFVVMINDVTIKVLGTSFEVKSVAGAASANGIGGPASAGGIDGGASTELAVETGAVRVCRGGDSLILHAGERITIAGKKRWQKEPNRDKLYGYYLGRPLVCDSIPLRRLVEVLNEVYDAHVVIGRPELGDLPLTTVFRHEPLDRILAVVAATFDLSVVRQGRTIILQ